MNTYKILMFTPEHFRVLDRETHRRLLDVDIGADVDIQADDLKQLIQLIYNARKKHQDRNKKDGHP